MKEKCCNQLWYNKDGRKQGKVVSAISRTQHKDVGDHKISVKLYQVSHIKEGKDNI